MNQELHNTRSFAEIFAETKEELKQFADTRIAMLKAEVQDKLTMLKMAAPIAAVGILMLVTAYFLFTLALVGLVAAFLKDNPYRWAIGFAAVAVLWAIVGGIAAYFAKREFESRELVPKKTIGVLKQDKTWIESEVRHQA